jgi:hypothetical protein
VIVGGAHELKTNPGIRLQLGPTAPGPNYALTCETRRVRVSVYTNVCTFASDPERQ